MRDPRPALDEGTVRTYIVGTEVAVKARIVRIGNSQGVRIPKPLLEEARLGDEVEIRAEAGRIVIERADAPRAGWSEAFEAMTAAGDDALLDAHTPTVFDETEWTW